jgi:hypothetical protein
VYNTKMKVYISYGWPEGRWHSKQLVEALKKQGCKVVSSPEDAAVIIAHSAGCYMLPQVLTARVILLIGLPNWPDKPLVKCMLEKLSLESKDKQWFQKTFWHVTYAISQPIRSYRAFRTHRKKYLPNYSENQVILVHNQQDTYMNVAVSKQLAKQRKWFLRNLEGQHDDLWQNPQSYIDIIKEYAV